MSIQIIGGGLYGCLTAYHIAKKFPELKIHIIEAGDHLLSAFDPIVLANMKFNNGFHGFELPRSQDLFDFIKNELECELVKMPNKRGLYIKGELIPYENKLKQWPKNFHSFFIKEPGNYNSISDLRLSLSKNYNKFLNRIGYRYSSKTDDIEHLLLPWFLPSDYKILSEDEGDIFREKIRSGIITGNYGYPKNNLFKILQSSFYNKLKTMNINIHCSTKVDFSKSKIEYQSLMDDQNIPNPKKGIIFNCTSLAIMLKGINPQLFKQLLSNKRFLLNGVYKYECEVDNNYSEILVADELCPQLSRISFPSQTAITGGRRLIQCEFFVNSDDEIKKLEKSSHNDIVRVLNYKNMKLELLDLQKSRTVFFPDLGIQNQAISVLKEWTRLNYPNLNIRPNFGPLNMSKTWIYSKENVRKVNFNG